jgi:hypothetical protein
MMKYHVVILLIAVLLAGILLSGCCQPEGPETVLLQGAVTIGPITPVEIQGQNPIVPPEVFASRHLVIYDGSGKNLVREVYFTQIGQGATGYYTAQIAPGTYVIDINHSGIDRADGLPQKITVVDDETITIDVNIDTGIR